MLNDTTLSFIGSGVMGEAMIRGILTQNLIAPEAITASDPLAERVEELHTRYGVRGITDNRQAARDGKILVLSIKPQTVSKVLPEIRAEMASDSLVISIVAGTPIAVIQRDLGVEAVVRAMPNTPAQIGEGITVWTATPAATDAMRKQAQAILGALGEEIYVDDESYLDMATALSGTGPAYVFLFMEALIDAGVHMGFSTRGARAGLSNRRRLGHDRTADGAAPGGAAQPGHLAGRHHRGSALSTGKGRSAHGHFTRRVGGLSTIQDPGGAGKQVNYVIANVVDTMFRIFYILIFVDIMASWLVALKVKLPDFVYQILAAVHTIVTPILAPFRRVIPSIGGLDITPIIALFVLQFAQRFIVSALRGGY